MTCQNTGDDKPKTPQGDIPGTLPAKGEEENHISVTNRDESKVAADDTKDPVRPWRVRESIINCWSFVKKQESTNVATAIATVVIAIATAFTWGRGT